MPKAKIEFLQASWLDIDRISDFYLREVGPVSAEKPSMRSWSISGYLVSILMPDRFTQIRCWPNRNTANWC